MDSNTVDSNLPGTLYIGVRETARLAGVAYGTMLRYLKAGKGPEVAGHLAGRQPIFLPAVVEAWIAANPVKKGRKAAKRAAAAAPTAIASVMASETIEERVRVIVAVELDVDPSIVNHTSDLVDDLGADELAMVELVLAIEEHYSINLSDTEMLKVSTVAQLVALVTSVVAPQTAVTAATE